MLQVSEVSLQPMEVHRVERQFVDEYWYRWMPKRGCDSLEGHTGAGSSEDLWREKPLLEQVL